MKNNNSESRSFIGLFGHLLRPIKTFFYSLWLLLAFSTLLYGQVSSLDSLQAQLRTLPVDTNRVNTLVELFNASFSQGVNKIRPFAEEALMISEEIDYSKGKARAYTLLAYCYHEEGNDPRAIEYLLNALHLYREQKAMSWVAGTYNNLGNVYLFQKDFKSALDCFSKAREILSRFDQDGIELARVLRNIADVYKQQQQDSVAYEYFRKALEVSENINDSSGICSVRKEIGCIHVKRKEFMEALKCQQQALSCAISTNGYTLQTEIYGSLSEVYMGLGDYQAALDAAEKSLELASRLHLKPEIEKGYYWVAQVHKAIGNYEMALKFFMSYTILHDSLRSSENMAAIGRIQNNFDVKEKELLITQLQEKHKTQRNLLIGALVSVFIIGLLIYSRQRVVIGKKLEMKRQQLNFHMLSLKEKSEALEKISHELETLKSGQLNTEKQIERFNAVLQANILTQEDWENFKVAFEEVYPRFFATLRFQYSDITPSELRIAALIKLNLSLKESAMMLGISEESVKKARYRLKKRLLISEADSMENYIQRI